MGTRKNGRARRRHARGEEGSLTPCVSPSRAPVLSFARYFQAPATQAKVKRTWKIGRSFEGKLYFVRTLRLKFVTSPVVKQVPGVGRMTAQLRQLKFQSYFFSPQIKHKVYLSLVRRLEGHSSQSISDSFRRKTGSIRPTSSVEESISLQHLL